MIDVGYNDTADTYSAGLDEVMQALLANGVQRVVWVTLEEQEDVWLSINEQIRAAPARWPQLVVADWGPSATGQPWLKDVAHLNHDGGVALGQFLRPVVLSQVQLVVDSDPAGSALAGIGARADGEPTRSGALVPSRRARRGRWSAPGDLHSRLASPLPDRQKQVTCTATDREAGNKAVGSFQHLRDLFKGVIP